MAESTLKLKDIMTREARTVGRNDQLAGGRVNPS